MSLTRKDILDHARGTEKQKEMFEYWDEQPEQKDPRLVSPLEMVREYHETAGLGLDFKLEKSLGDNIEKAQHDREWKEKVQKLCNLRHNLIEEEFQEVRDASWLETDYLLKELADLVYVVYGTAATFGWDLDEAVRRVHENNMGRMYQPDGSIKRREDGKIMKNRSYPSVDLSDLV